MKRKTYNVLAVPEGEKFWVVRIYGLPEGLLNTTQALQERGERDIEEMARDFISLMLEVDQDSFDLNIVKQNPDPGLAERLQHGIEQAERKNK